ncbi:magnesium transporter [Leucothrix pacifica]|uniref:Magnesium transporter MgtE n=1 Tax=Leucothrix pacifica TaxID=1247513 RepID=A0A317C9B5_9GAMM|nr:magnesium transporter [Leucothrix pacifica]PWQ94959.1 magnesium transporter [Leucothrix pacifica]
MGNQEHLSKEDRLASLSGAIESGSLFRLQRMLNALHPAEIAHLLESSPLEQRKIAWELIKRENEGLVLIELNDDVRSQLTEEMDTGDLIEALKDLDTDDMADFLQGLPDTVIQETLSAMGRQERERVEVVLGYDEDTAGGLMDTEVVTIRSDVTVEVVLRYLRMRGDLPSHTDRVIVVDSYDKYLGVVSLSKLLTSQPDDSILFIMDHEYSAIHADTDKNEVAALFEDRDLISAPVINEVGKLLGRITIDDVVDVIRDEAEHSIKSMAGLNEEDDLFAPILPSVKRRAVWLGTNLITAFMAAAVISQFTETIESAVALAVLMGIVPSMGGIAGSQTLTMVIRGIALGQIGKSNTHSLLRKELLLGLINGVIWAVVVFAISAIALKDIEIGILIGVAMLLNLLAAPLSGVLLPLTLRKMNIDPALAGSVLLTTVTDIVGYAGVLGLASLLLPYLRQIFA